MGRPFQVLRNGQLCVEKTFHTWSAFDRCRLKSIAARLSGADSNHLLDICDENLAGLSRIGKRLNDLIDQVRCYGKFKFDLRQEVASVFGSPVTFGMALLTAEPLHFGDRHVRRPRVASVSRTSSSRNGFITVVTNFISRLLSNCGKRFDSCGNRGASFIQ